MLTVLFFFNCKFSKGRVILDQNLGKVFQNLEQRTQNLELCRTLSCPHALNLCEKQNQ